jgi:hypothetical protein
MAISRLGVNMKKIIFVNKYGNKFVVENMELNEAIEKYRPSIGLDARWLPDFLEGAETKEVQDDENIGHTEYLHPAEYAYEIVEETLASIKARKIAELSAISLQKNEWISGNKAYQVANIAMGRYIAEGKKSKEDGYKADFIARSTQLTTELDRCVTLVNAATTEIEINNIEFSLQ